MHISDGVLPTPVIIGGLVASAAILSWSARKTSADDLPKLAVVTSAFFVATLIHVPLGPTSVHLLIPGLVGILLGSGAFVSIFLGIVLQSLLFQFGGITAIGANAILMGVPALICGWLFRHLKGHSPAQHTLAGAVTGGLGVVLSALILAALLVTSGEDFFGVARIALYAHLPVMAIEAAICGFAVSFLNKVKPDMLDIGSHPQEA
ncbi:MAG: cobalt transporter CbiM [Acidobacteriota bacterium]